MKKIVLSLISMAIVVATASAQSPVDEQAGFRVGVTGDAIIADDVKDINGRMDFYDFDGYVGTVDPMTYKEKTKANVDSTEVYLTTSASAKLSDLTKVDNVFIKNTNIELIASIYIPDGSSKRKGKLGGRMYYNLASIAKYIPAGNIFVGSYLIYGQGGDIKYSGHETITDISNERVLSDEDVRVQTHIDNEKGVGVEVGYRVYNLIGYNKVDMTFGVSYQYENFKTTTTKHSYLSGRIDVSQLNYDFSYRSVKANVAINYKF